MATNAEKHLVGVPSASCPELLLVAPGTPSESFLWRKLATDPPLCGARMPFGGAPLPPAALDCVREWIERLGRHDAGTDARSP
jgi:hypothetical protein